MVLTAENLLPSILLEGLLAGGATEVISWRLFDSLLDEAVLSIAERADMLARVRNVLLHERTQGALAGRRARAEAEAEQRAKVKARSRKRGK